MLSIVSIPSPRSGRPVANQIIIENENQRLFFSYGTFIAIQYPSGKAQLSARFYRYSRTTSRYLAQFLGIRASEIQARINSGMYELADLQRLPIAFSVFPPQVLAS